MEKEEKEYLEEVKNVSDHIGRRKEGEREAGGEAKETEERDREELKDMPAYVKI